MTSRSQKFSELSEIIRQETGFENFLGEIFAKILCLVLCEGLRIVLKSESNHCLKNLETRIRVKSENNAELASR